MSRHLKTTVLNGLKSTCATLVQLPPSTPVYSKGVRYLMPCAAIESLWGAMDDLKEGRKRRKHIILRHCVHRPGLLQFYTYHFPKTWSKACVTNREIIKEAQRRAHALEHLTTREAIEWRIRFFKHYYRVFKGHEKPEPGLKAYSRFYQYVYVSIYRDLKAALQPSQNQDLALTPDDISFDPIEYRPLRSSRPASSLQSLVHHVYSPPLLLSPALQDVLN